MGSCPTPWLAFASCAPGCVVEGTFDQVGFAIHCDPLQTIASDDHREHVVDRLTSESNSEHRRNRVRSAQEARERVALINHRSGGNVRRQVYCGDRSAASRIVRAIPRITCMNPCPGNVCKPFQNIANQCNLMQPFAAGVLPLQRTITRDDDGRSWSLRR